MSAQRLTVERDGYCWSVFKNGLRVFGPTGNQAQAEEKRDKLEREARRKRRPCITCGDPFLSDGPGNRMCDKCRARASEMFWGAV